jgi:hypothetical protein
MPHEEHPVFHPGCRHEEPHVIARQQIQVVNVVARRVDNGCRARLPQDAQHDERKVDPERVTQDVAADRCERRGETRAVAHQYTAQPREHTGNREQRARQQTVGARLVDATPRLLRAAAGKQRHDHDHSQQERFVPG